MLPLIRQMVSVVDDAPTDLMVLSFERLTESSDSFDAVVNELLDFWFPKADRVSLVDRRRSQTERTGSNITRGNENPGESQTSKYSGVPGN